MEIETPLGSVQVFFEGNTVAEIVLPGASPSHESVDYSEFPESETEVDSAFKEYFQAQGKTEVHKAWKRLVDVSNITIKVDSFKSNVYASLVNDVPGGEVISYSDLAGLAGSPAAARAVGSAMRTNPLPIVVPCHRVLESNGGLGGYMGTEENGLKMKQWLLEHEGAL